MAKEKVKMSKEEAKELHSKIKKHAEKKGHPIWPKKEKKVL